MVFLQKRKWQAAGSMLLLCVLMLSSLFMLQKGAAAARRPPTSLPVEPGTYQVVTTCSGGSKAGQQERGVYVIVHDGSLTTTFAGVGTGYGSINQMWPPLLSFREPIGNGRDVEVTQLVTSVNAKGFISKGYGQLYSQDRSVGGPSQIVSVATRMVSPPNPTSFPTGKPIASVTPVPPTPTGTPTGSGTDASGQAMPTGDLPGWHQIFAQDFTTAVPLGSFPGTAYGNKFSVYPDGTPDTAGQHGAPSRYYPSKVISVSNGLLNLHLHTEHGTPMAAAILPTLPGTHLYGKYTIRFRSDALRGFKTAWLLWPDSGNWPHDGEIDFPEGDLSGNINAFVHHQHATNGDDQDAYSTPATYTAWHTASIEWTPNKVVFILDGKTIGTSTTRIPATPMHWVIQTESCLDGCPAASTAGALQIAWVVAYSLTK